MDRITKSNEYNQIREIKNTEKTSPQEGIDRGFKSTLETLMTNAGKTEVPQTGSVLPPPRAMAINSIYGDMDMEDNIRELLESMEKFSKALMNPRRSIRELSPMAEALGREAEELFNKNQSDTNIQDFARRTAVLARVEVEKFRRGDFA